MPGRGIWYGHRTTPRLSTKGEIQVSQQPEYEIHTGGEILPFRRPDDDRLVDVYDAETLDTNPAPVGPPVDSPNEPRTVYGTIVSRDAGPRAPIVPAWLRSHDQRLQVARWAVGYGWYVARFHAWRSPKYLGKTVVWAPVGVARGTVRTVRWAAATEHTAPLMADAVRKRDHAAFLTVNRERKTMAKGRWILLGSSAAASSAGVGFLVVAGPGWVQVAASIGATLAAAWLGRPVDRPIIDRVSQGPRFTRLTADMTRKALVSIGACKQPGDVTFPQEIHRDGPGWLARVNLPAGVEAIDVVEKRGRLSSALRLPVDQVWPAKGPDHEGQLDLWVGYQPASKMGQPKWALASDSARTSVFEPFEFGTDPRQRPVKTVLFQRNWLIGGVPGSGKSYAARTLALIAALDPTCELKIAEFKGTADFGDLEKLCSTYVCGVDDEAIGEGAQIIAWGLAEAERRGRRIRAARERGEAPEGKVTPELAARPGSGLHPVLILIDEAHELFGASPEAADAAERLIKRGRALGIIVVLATQIPDAKSLPPNITRCVNSRWCLAVGDQFANDAILGTSAYRQGLRATVYRPGVDAGWGLVVGLPEPVSVRSFYPTPETAARMIERATRLRGGHVVGGDDQGVKVTLDVLRDVEQVFVATQRPGLHWEALAELLGERHPELYAGIGPDALSAMLRREGVPSDQVKVGGVNLRGCRLEAVRSALSARELESGSEPGSGTS